jgi:CelD/BcsL family acetyltransferase involved in cellulose biosynthesis
MYLLAFEGSELVGGIALESERQRGVEYLRFLGAGALSSHAMDMVATSEHRSVVARALWDHFVGRPHLIVDLEGTFADSALVGIAPSSARLTQLDESATIEDPGDFEHYLATRDRHLRQEIRRIERRLGERGIEYRTIDATAIDEALVDLQQLHGLRWEGESGFLPGYDRFVRAARIGARRNELLIHELTIGDRVLASLVTFELDGICSLYQMGRLPAPEWSGTGTMLKACVIRHACRRGVRVVDLGPGALSSKEGWLDRRWVVLRMRWGIGRGRALLTAQRIKARFSHRE